MRKILIIGLIVALALVVVGGAGIVYAGFRGYNNFEVRSVIVPNNRLLPQSGIGPGGMMGGNGNTPGGMMERFGNRDGERGFTFGPGMMGRSDLPGGQGIIRQYMLDAFATAVDLSTDDVQTRLANGETFKEIAVAQGNAVADLPAFFDQVWQAALDQAVADGAITAAQADVMRSHMSNYRDPGYGPGNGNQSCPLWDEQQQP